MTDREALIAMLRRAVNPNGADFVHVSPATVSVCTGPDDSMATFRFSEDGTIREVEVMENGWLPPDGTWLPSARGEPVVEVHAQAATASGGPPPGDED